MGENVLSKYTSRIDPDGHDATVFDLDVTDDLGCFGWLRGVRERALMLELRKKSGNTLAINYGFIETIAYDPSAGITITSGATAIRIQGRNLNAEVRPCVGFLQGLLRHRVPWIQEADRIQAMEAPEGACVVESIEW